MKSPSPAPLYATILPVLTETARGLGYALAVHGTLSRDLDLIAVPWVDDAAPPEELVQALAARVAWTRDDGMLIQGPERKPYGRLAWTIPLCGDAFVDLSVALIDTEGMTEAEVAAEFAVHGQDYAANKDRVESYLAEVTCPDCDGKCVGCTAGDRVCNGTTIMECTMDFEEALRALKEGMWSPP